MAVCMPGLPSKLGTPPVADGHHFDLVRTPADGFFEMLNGHLSWGPDFSVRNAGDFTPSSRCDQAKTIAKAVVHSPSRPGIIGRSE